MAKKKYLAVDVDLKEIDVDSFDGKIVDVIKYLEGVQAEYEDTFQHLRIVVESGGWDAPHDFILRGTRQETDPERDKRLAKAKKRREATKKTKAQEKAAEIEQLKELLNKHGGDLQFDIHKLMFENQ